MCQKYKCRGVYICRYERYVQGNTNDNDTWLECTSVDVIVDVDMGEGG